MNWLVTRWNDPVDPPNGNVSEALHGCILYISFLVCSKLDRKFSAKERLSIAFTQT